jgi:hypothetical protein
MQPMTHALTICWTKNATPRLLVANCSCGWRIELRGSNIAALKKTARTTHAGHEKRIA